MSHIFRASLIIAVSFGLNKILALVRQYSIASQFGFSAEIDAFNVANNLPDLIFSLFSGGALAMAFIPVFAEYLSIQGRDRSWKLFSKVATFIFLISAFASLVIAIVAPAIVSSQFGIAPGFDSYRQGLVVELLRINLIATLIFSLSGLVTASLQAYKHFLLPAIAPIFYNLGIIIGSVFLAPASPVQIYGIRLPTFGMGIYGLTYGVVIGALMHLLIQIPGLLQYKFRFSFSLDVHDAGLKKIFRLMGPRILTVFLIQIMFLMRDNFASRLEVGAVTALTYGFFIMQVPETLIGTSLATALLPTLATYMSADKKKEFAQTLTKAIRVLIASSLFPTVISFVLLAPLVDIMFDFSPSHAALLVHTTYAFMAALLAHTILEVLVRAFYAKQNTTIPLYATFLRTIVFIVLGAVFYQTKGAVGIAAIDSIAVIVETLILFILLIPFMNNHISLIKTFGRSIKGAVIGLGVSLALFAIPTIPIIVKTSATFILATLVYVIFVKEELKLLFKL